MFKTKGKKNALEQLLIKEGEREVLHSFGKFKVYAPDERFQVFVDGMLKEASKQRKKNVELSIDNEEVLLILLDLITNFEEEYPELMELENFKELMENKDRHPRNLKKMLTTAEKVGLEELIVIAQGIHSFKELPKGIQKGILENNNGSSL